MSICRNCGATISDAAKFCRNCGAPVAADHQDPGQDLRESQTMLLQNDDPWDDDEADSFPAYAAGTSRRMSQPPIPTPQAAQYQSPRPASPQPQHQAPQPGSPQAAPAVSVWDHTAEFDARDVSENKAMSIIVYLMGLLGVIAGLLKKGESPFLDFHLKQGIKFVAMESIILTLTVLFSWMVPLGIGGAVNQRLSGMNSLAESLTGDSVYTATGIPPAIPMVIYSIIGIAAALLLILKVISAFSAASGKAKEPAILRSLGFLK